MFAPPSEDPDKVLAIDSSYLVFHRFMAQVAWSKKAGVVKPERAQGEPCPPATDAELTSFGDSLRQALVGLMRTYNVGASNVYMLVDCSRADIWRRDIHPEYKATRASPGGMPPNVFVHFHSVVLPDIVETLGVKQIACPRAEADDIAAVLCRYFTSLGKTVTVVSADADLCQLASPDVQVFDIKGVNILDKACAKAGLTNADPVAYLHCKVIAGDRGDNVNAIKPRLGPRTALKLLQDPALLEKELAVPETRRRYEENKKLVDLTRLPTEIEEAVMLYLRELSV
jgi:5'-3' exonuclease